MHLALGGRSRWPGCVSRRVGLFCQLLIYFVLPVCAVRPAAPLWAGVAVQVPLYLHPRFLLIPSHT